MTRDDTKFQLCRFNTINVRHVISIFRADYNSSALKAASEVFVHLHFLYNRSAVLSALSVIAGKLASFVFLT